MKIVPFDDNNWKKDHPSGLIKFQHMLKGDPAEPDNFMYVLAKQEGDFLMPRHRHNFDQIRLPLSGDMNLGRGWWLREGQVGYFPEGLAYGPQQDLGTRLLLALQFAGASNYGFMSIEERRRGMAEMVEAGGKFVGPHYHHPNGKVEWSLNAIWYQVYGTKLKYPRSRYANLVIAEPKCFNWLPVVGQSGVDRKFMGSFSERAVWIEMLRLRAGATWASNDTRGRRLLVVLSGEGDAEGQAIGQYAALQAESDETLHVTATSEMELYVIGMPPVIAPTVESDQFDDEELPAEEAATEDAASKEVVPVAAAKAAPVKEDAIATSN